MNLEDVIAPTPVEIGTNFTPTVEQPESGSLRALSHRKAAGCRTRDDLDDAELVNQCRDGDTAAFERLVTKYRRRAYAIVYAMVQNEQDARDLAQEGFVRAWGGIHRFKGRSSFYTWLYRIMRNVAVDSLRKKRICADGESYELIAAANIMPEARTAPSAAPLPANALQRKETRQQINDAVAQLPPVHRAVIVMKEFECLQYNEIAEILQCSIGTVMSRIYYARRKLQVLLRDLYENL
jgi:RNA polymerase sigma-70 factor (ECF subfamily)